MMDGSQGETRQTVALCKYRHEDGYCSGMVRGENSCLRVPPHGRAEISVMHWQKQQAGGFVH